MKIERTYPRSHTATKYYILNLHSTHVSFHEMPMWLSSLQVLLLYAAVVATEPAILLLCCSHCCYYCGCNLASHRSVACVSCGKLAHLAKQFSNLVNYSVYTYICVGGCCVFDAHVARNKVYPLKMPINKFNLIFALTLFDWDVTF